MTQTIPSKPTVRQSRRDDRWSARHVLWKLSRVARRRECGFKVRDAAGVSVKVTNSPEGRQAGYAGLSSCASVWCCPVCSAKIANARQIEIQLALAEWVRRGGRVVMGTVTMRHYQHHELAQLWDGLSGARHAMLSGGAWKSEQKYFGTPMARVVKTGKHAGETVVNSRVPVISVVEVTHGVHGWHVHLHMLLLVSGHLGAGDVATMGAGLFGRWSDSLVGAGFVAPSRLRGQRFDLLEGDPAKALGDYFTKSVYAVSDEDLKAASMETARGDMKDAHHGNRTPFGILRGLVDVVTTGDLGGRSAESVAIDEGVWHDWEKGSAGRRQIAWSVGLREYLKRVLPVEAPTDQQIVDVDAGGDEVHTMSAMTWGAVRRARAGARLLSAYETSEEAGELLLARFEDAGYRHEAARVIQLLPAG